MSNYNLQKFVKEYETDYNIALREIKNGRKESHWMWYIFPQLKGLGMSYMANYYGLSGIDEAKAFLSDPYLGVRLKEITSALLSLKTSDALEVMGYPDNLKLKSSMTLFALASDLITTDENVFKQFLDKYFNGEYDTLTIKLLKRKEA